MTNTSRQTSNLIQRYGAYFVGFLSSLVALSAAIFMPAYAPALIGMAGTLAVLTLLLTQENDRFGLRLLGMLAAGCALAFAFSMPEQARQLLTGAGTIALLSLLLA